MQMNSGIILAGQPVNALESYMGGQQAGQQRIEWDRQNALAKLYRDQGAGIVAGDPNALNALAGMDPQAAMQMQTQQQGLAMDQERLQMARAAAAREAEAWAGQTDAATIAAERDRLANGLKGASFFYSQGDRKGYEAFLAQQGLDPAQVPFDQFPAFAAGAEGVLEVLQGFTPAPQTAADVTKGAGEGKMWIDPNDPTKGVTDIPGAAQSQAFRNATPEEAAQYGAAAGQFGPDGRFYPVAPPSKGVTQTIENPDGTKTTIQVGGAAPVSGTGEATVGQVYNPNEINSVVDMIDQIAQDPNLPNVVGDKAVLLGGGNMVGDLNLAQRLGYGAGGISVIEKIGQLQSNAWLSARAMLKGGGAITDYESRKAEAAVARLERPKNEADFRAALKELRDAITEGQAKLAGTSAKPAAPTDPPEGVEPAIWDAMTPEEKALFQ